MSDLTPDRTAGHSVDDTKAAGVESKGGDRAQYGMCAGLAALGVLLLVDASRLSTVQSNDALGPKPVPMVLGCLLLLVSVFYAIDIWRGGVGAAEEGEDVDLS